MVKSQICPRSKLTTAETLDENMGVDMGKTRIRKIYTLVMRFNRSTEISTVSFTKLYDAIEEAMREIIGTEPSARDDEDGVRAELENSHCYFGPNSSYWIEEANLVE